MGSIMIKHILGIACLWAGFGAVAQAADLAAVETPAVEPAFNWTGFYAGVHGGYGWGKFDTDEVDPAVHVKPDGWLGGGQVGFNYQFGNNLVLGVEADAAFADLKDSTSTRLDIIDDIYHLDITAESKIDAFGTVRGRIAYAADRFLPYVTGGLAWADVKYSVNTVGVLYGDPVSNDSASTRETMTGWVLGGGLEYALTNHVTAKAEYLYADLGSHDFELDAGPFRADVIVQTAKLGLNYKF